MPLALFIEGIEVANVQPLAGKLDGHPPRSVARSKPTGVRGEHIGISQPARGGCRQKRGIGRGGDQKVAEPRGELPVVERHLRQRRTRCFAPIQEMRRDEDSRQNKPYGLLMRQLFLAQGSVKTPKILALRRRQRSAISALCEH